MIYLTTFTAIEYVSVDKRSVIGNVSMAVGLSLAGASEAWILKAMGDWKVFHVILFAQGAFVLVTPL